MMTDITNFLADLTQHPFTRFMIHAALLSMILISVRLFLLKRTSEQEHPKIYIIHRLLKSTWIVFLCLIAFHTALAHLELSKSFIHYEKIILYIIVGLQVFIWSNIIIEFVIQHIIRRETTTENYNQFILTSGPIRLMVQLISAAIIVIIVLGTLGVNVTGLVAGLGIGGIALALAVQNILKDLLSALSIALNKPFMEGDFIVIGDKMGTVERTGLQTTTIRALSGEQLIMNNNDILSSRVQNYKRMRERRVEFRFSIAHKTPSHIVKTISGIITDIVTPIPKTRLERAHFKEFSDLGLVFELVYWVLDPDYTAYMDVQQQINVGLMEKFEEMDVSFATPMRVIQLGTQLEDVIIQGATT